MNSLRTYGKAPYTIAVIHGGPGAGGEMAPLARALAADWGVLEPIQTAASLDGQVEELRAILENHGQLPASLIGYSWGAWLSYILAARYPAIVKKLILVSSGPFEAHYAAALHATRMSRLSAEEQAEFTAIIGALGEPDTADKDLLLARLGALAAIADSYEPIEDEMGATDLIGPRGDMFQSVWQEAAEMRKNGRLLTLGGSIHCPVTAIHGSYDPHPAEGVRLPLSATVKDFQFILLENCGHTPWQERWAQATFYRILRDELRH